MKLTELPVEVLLSIWDLPLPDDFENLLLSCREAYRIGTIRRLHTHQDLKSRYSLVELIEQHPGNLLYNVWLNSQVVDYIRCIEFTDWGPDGAPNEENIKRALPSLLRVSEERIGHVWLSQDDQEQLLRGDRTRCFWLLLSLLTQVKRLRIIDDYCDVQWAARQFYGWFIKDSSPNSKSILCNLETVEVCWDTGTGLQFQPVENAAIWTMVPSVRRVLAENVCCTDRDWPFELNLFFRDKSFQSSVESIEIYEGCIDATMSSRIRDFFRPLKNLKTFRYSHFRFCAEDVREHDFNPGLLVEMVADTVGKTLRTLGIKSEERDPSDAIDDLLAFEVLEDLRIEGSSFLAASETDDDEAGDDDTDDDDTDDDVVVPALVDVLPPSLKCLAINLMDLEDEERDRLFHHWEGKSVSAMPNLKRVVYDGQKLPRELQKQIKSSGVGLSRVMWRDVDKVGYS